MQKTNLVYETLKLKKCMETTVLLARLTRRRIQESSHVLARFNDVDTLEQIRKALDVLARVQSLLTRLS
jgi:hypothetical protein